MESQPLPKGICSIHKEAFTLICGDCFFLLCSQCSAPHSMKFSHQKIIVLNVYISSLMMFLEFTKEIAEEMKGKLEALLNKISKLNLISSSKESEALKIEAKECAEKILVFLERIGGLQFAFKKYSDKPEQLQEVLMKSTPEIIKSDLDLLKKIIKEMHDKYKLLKHSTVSPDSDLQKINTELLKSKNELLQVKQEIDSAIKSREQEEAKSKKESEKVLLMQKEIEHLKKIQIELIEVKERKDRELAKIELRIEVAKEDRGKNKVIQSEKMPGILYEDKINKPHADKDSPIPRPTPVLLDKQNINSLAQPIPKNLHSPTDGSPILPFKRDLSIIPEVPEDKEEKKVKEEELKECCKCHLNDSLKMQHHTLICGHYICLNCAREKAIAVINTPNLTQLLFPCLYCKQDYPIKRIKLKCGCEQRTRSLKMKIQAESKGRVIYFDNEKQEMISPVDSSGHIITYDDIYMLYGTMACSFAIEKGVVSLKGGERLLEMCRGNTIIRDLELLECGITASSLPPIAALIQESPVIKELDLSENPLQDDGIKLLSDALILNTSLEIFIVSNTHFGEKGAKYLFGEALVKNTSLLDIEVNRNSIGKLGAKYVAIAIKKHSILKELDLSENDLGQLGAESLAEVLKADPGTISQLQLLEITSNNICEKGCVALVGGLKACCKSLAALDLEHNAIGNGGAKALWESIKAFPALKCLRLADNGITKDAIINLASGYKAPQVLPLKELDLRKNILEADGFKALGELITGNPNLLLLDVSDTKAMPSGIQFISLALKHPGTALKSLHMKSLEMGPEGAKEMAVALAYNKNLEVLNLLGNCIKDTGAKFLGEALAINGGLKLLDVSLNGLGTVGTKILCDGLKNNGSLRGLVIGHNLLGPKGAYELGELIKNSKCLKELSTVSNGFGEKGMKVLCDAIKDSKTLESLNISSNNIADKGACFLAEAILTCKSLSNLDLESNEIGDLGVQALTTALYKKVGVVKRINFVKNKYGRVGQESIETIAGYCGAIVEYDACPGGGIS